MRSFVSSLLVLLLAALVSAASPRGDRLLVILEDVADKASYSKYFGDLKGRGYDLSYETPKSESLKLFHLGERTFDHVMLFPTKAKGLGPNLTPQILLDFVNAQGNIMLALTSKTAAPSSIVSLLLELDIHLPIDRTGLVVDHFNYDAASSPESHDVLVLPTPGPLRPGVKDFFSPASSDGELIAFPNGLGQTLGSGALLSPILRAPSTAYSYNPKEDSDALDTDLFAAGQQLSLITTFQARNSARFTVVGSADMLTDKWFDAKVKKVGSKKAVKTLNRPFAKAISGWTFGEIGQLRVNWVEHHLNEAGAANVSNPGMYRIKNDVTYSISLSEYSWDKYVPLVVSEADDLQLEFSMLSPFHRLNLSPVDSNEDSTTFSTSFRLPDQHGIFNFLVNYKRPFLSNIEEKRTVSVRHFAHDEWPRSYVITGAWPWLGGIAATVVGFLGFCALWLYSKPVPNAAGSKKTQ